MAAAIDHPSILPIYEAGEFEGQPFLVMRHVPGTDLKALIERKGRLEPSRAVEIVLEIGGALDAAHRRGLVHRDVKPANILIGDEADEEVVYLTDFGLTKGRSDERLTQTGKWVGTVDYMAPEQIEGKDVDGRADQYALACVLYEALTGAVPFRATATCRSCGRTSATTRRRPSEVRPELGTAIDDVIARAMAKEPEDRYATCRELARAASEALGVAPRRRRLRPARAARSPAAPSSAAPLAAGRSTGGGGTVVGGDAPSPPPTSQQPAASSARRSRLAAAQARADRRGRRPADRHRRHRRLRARRRQRQEAHRHGDRHGRRGARSDDRRGHPGDVRRAVVGRTGGVERRRHERPGRDDAAARLQRSHRQHGAGRQYRARGVEPAQQHAVRRGDVLDRRGDDADGHRDGGRRLPARDGGRGAGARQEAGAVRRPLRPHPGRRRGHPAGRLRRRHAHRLPRASSRGRARSGRASRTARSSTAACRRRTSTSPSATTAPTGSRSTAT